MKLELNCIRDTLLCLEDWLVLTDELEFKSLTLHEIHTAGIMQKYTLPEIAYTISKLEEAGLIKAYMNYANDCINYIGVSSLTFYGHQFLDTIRPDSTWDKIYAICEKTGLKSLHTIMEISEMLLPDTIKSAIGIKNKHSKPF